MKTGQAMTPAEKGRFCGLCQKVVHDFTRSSDREIAEVLAKGSNACGRFINSQLNRELVTPKEKNTAWIAASAAVVSVLAVGTDAVAQTPVPTEQQPQQTNELLGKVALSEPDHVITGTVKDSSGLAIPGVNVIVKGTLISTQTDHEGNYNIEAKPGDTIEFSFVGYITTLVTVNDDKQVNICLKEDIQFMGEIIIADKRTFFGRLFTSIANWFREEDRWVEYKSR